MNCTSCSEPLAGNGDCVNPNCSVAQAQATRAASRLTAKATAAASTTEPRAYSITGSVD